MRSKTVVKVGRDHEPGVDGVMHHQVGHGVALLLEAADAGEAQKGDVAPGAALQARAAAHSQAVAHMGQAVGGEHLEGVAGDSGIQAVALGIALEVESPRFLRRTGGLSQTVAA